jgi:hypothetical protein
MELAFKLGYDFKVFSDAGLSRTIWANEFLKVKPMIVLL